MNASPLALPITRVLVALAALALSVRRFGTLRRSSHGRLRRNGERVALSLVILLCACIAASTAFNAVALRYYRIVYRAPGKLYTVDNYRMHLNCMGQGSPTIVLESGLGEDSLIWGKVQPVLSNTTRVCSYDRAGMGWSAPHPGPRDADEIADQLHALLQAAAIDGPIVLMGHSIGGLYVRDYATRRISPESSWSTAPRRCSRIMAPPSYGPSCLPFPAISTTLPSWCRPSACSE